MSFASLKRVNSDKEKAEIFWSNEEERSRNKPKLVT